jgi:hypothetical protein
MLIFPLGDNWRATFSLEHSVIADYRDDVVCTENLNPNVSNTICNLESMLGHDINS